MKREQEHMAKFFHMCHEYAKEIGLDAQFLIEPKARNRRCISTTSMPPPPSRS